MTYKDLLQRLLELDEKQLDMTLTVLHREDDEWFPATFAVYTGQNDVVQNGNPYIVFS